MNRTSSLPTRGGRYALAALFIAAWISACETKTIPEDDVGGAGTSANAGTGNRAGATSSAGTGVNAGDAGEAGDNGMPEAGSTSMGGRAGGGAGGAGAGASGAPVANGGSAGGAVACGNNKVEAGEECDDGNKKNGDGCSETCTSKCEKCEKDLCQADLGASFDNCFGNGALGVQPVVDGPGAGQTQAKVCQDLVSCARRTGCATQWLTSPILSCFCGNKSAPECQEKAEGPCAAEVAAAAYSLNFADVASRYNKSSFPVGRANDILTGCDASACGRECLQGKARTECESCTLGPSPTLLSHTCEDYFSCNFDDRPAKCASGGEPKDSCAANTCSPAVECALRTGCGAKNPLDCYADGNGPCADEFAKAANSTDSSVIARRITGDLDGNYASRVATRLLKCEADNCKAICFPGSTGGAGGNGGSGG